MLGISIWILFIHSAWLSKIASCYCRTSLFTSCICLVCLALATETMTPLFFLALKQSSVQISINMHNSFPPSYSDIMHFNLLYLHSFLILLGFIGMGVRDIGTTQYRWEDIMKHKSRDKKRWCIRQCVNLPVWHLYVKL